MAMIAALIRYITRDNTEALSLLEIQTANQSMKSSKALGVDRILADMLKTDLMISAQLIHRLIRNIWETGTFSVDLMLS